MFLGALSFNFKRCCRYLSKYSGNALYHKSNSKYMFATCGVTPSFTFSMLLYLTFWYISRWQENAAICVCIFVKKGFLTIQFIAQPIRKFLLPLFSFISWVKDFFRLHFSHFICFSHFRMLCFQANNKFWQSLSWAYNLAHLKQITKMPLRQTCCFPLTT